MSLVGPVRRGAHDEPGGQPMPKRHSIESLSVPQYVLARELDGECVLLNLNSGDYYGLDKVGTKMWNLVADGVDVESACGVLLAEYDASHERIRSDLEELVLELVARQLLVIDRD
jgi:hypothetical protein